MDDDEEEEKGQGRSEFLDSRDRSKRLPCRRWNSLLPEAKTKQTHASTERYIEIHTKTVRHTETNIHTPRHRRASANTKFAGVYGGRERLRHTDGQPKAYRQRQTQNQSDRQRDWHLYSPTSFLMKLSMMNSCLRYRNSDTIVSWLETLTVGDETVAGGGWWKKVQHLEDETPPPRCSIDGKDYAKCYQRSCTVNLQSTSLSVCLFVSLSACLNIYTQSIYLENMQLEN